MVDLSIIIPSYNTKDLLKACIESIVRETETEFEIIVVDNGSTDQTITQISNLKSQNQNLNLQTIQNKSNLGFAKAINQGLKIARREYILLLNSDTVILNRAIDKEIKFLETHEEVGAVGCQLKNLNGSIQPSGGYLPNLTNLVFWMTFLDDLPILRKIFKSYHVEDRDFYTHQRYLGWITGAFFLTRREVLEKVGFFDEKMFMYVEEVDWCNRLVNSGYKVAFDPNGTVVHYKGASTLAAKGGIIEEFPGIIYFFQKHKSKWQAVLVKFLIRIGILLRMLVFGIIKKDRQSLKLYAKAFKLA